MPQLSFLNLIKQQQEESKITFTTHFFNKKAYNKQLKLNFTTRDKHLKINTLKKVFYKQQYYFLTPKAIIFKATFFTNH